MLQGKFLPPRPMGRVHPGTLLLGCSTRKVLASQLIDPSTLRVETKAGILPPGWWSIYANCGSRIPLRDNVRSSRAQTRVWWLRVAQPPLGRPLTCHCSFLTQSIVKWHDPSCIRTYEDIPKENIMCKAAIARLASKFMTGAVVLRRVYCHENI